MHTKKTFDHLTWVIKGFLHSVSCVSVSVPVSRQGILVYHGDQDEVLEKDANNSVMVAGIYIAI